MGEIAVSLWRGGGGPARSQALGRLGELAARAAWLWAATAVGGAGLATWCGATRPWVRRVVRYWWHVGPILLRYHWVKCTARSEAEREEAYKRLHVRYAPAVRRIVEELRGMFVKLAQVVSVLPDAVPVEYQQELRKLQTTVPPARWASIREVLEQVLGRPVEALFEHIEQKPMGSASLGQAHLATWRGRCLIVKVQYPDSAAHMRADLSGLLACLWLTQSAALPMMQQIRRQFETELDYAQEAQHLRDLRAALAAAPEFRDRVVVPEPVPELTSRRVLGMEYLPGLPLVTVLEERLRALGLDASERSVAAFFGAGDGGAGGSAGADEGPRRADALAAGRALVGRAVTLLGPDRLLWLGRMASEARLRCQGCRRRAVAGLGAGRATGASPPPARVASRGEVRAMLRCVLDVHGYQLFFCPVFNGDPHPGNILALPDGRVGLIDLGQCVDCPPALKAQFARLLLVLGQPISNASDERVADLLLEMGVRTQRGDRKYLAFVTRFVLTRLRREWFKDDFVGEMLKRDNVVEQPLALVFISRTAELLRGLGFLAMENVCVAEAWRPWAERWLQEHGEAAP